MEACQSSYLNPQPVPPRTIAATRIAPATEPIMILVPLGPVGVKELGREGNKNKGKKHAYAAFYIFVVPCGQAVLYWFWKKKTTFVLLFYRAEEPLWLSAERPMWWLFCSVWLPLYFSGPSGGVGMGIGSNTLQSFPV